MGLQILNKVEKLWDQWDIPACVLLSLLFQFLLVLFASLRQRSKNGVLVSLIWSAYLVADWIPAVTIGLITKAQTDPFRRHGSQELYAFWACFLLLHLGGPDTITSFALEDNEFWLRHLFGLILQAVVAGYCMFLALPKSNLLWLPAILVFLVGSVKYAERTMSLYLASFNNFRATVGGVKETTNFDLNLAGSEESQDHMELLTVSYSLFQSCEGIVAGFVSSSKGVELSRKLFRQKIKEKPDVGFKLIEYELSFMYEVLHTKVAVVRSIIGFICRLSSFFLIIGAFLLFHFVVVVDYNKQDHKFGGFELSVTYALLIGAITLDTISGIQLLFSDWIIVSNNGLIKRWRKYIPKYVLKRKRWCGSVSQYNMIDYCLDERWIWNFNKYFPSSFRLIIDNIKFMLFLGSSSVDDFQELKCLMFEELTRWASLERRSDLILVLSEFNSFYYGHRVVQLHLATEICYHHQTETELESYTDEMKRARRMSKLISDYMFYLLIMKPEMMGVTGNRKIVLQDTIAEAKLKLMENRIYDHVKACIYFMDYGKDRSTNRHRNGIEASSKSLLSKACKEGREIRRTNWHKKDFDWLSLLCLATMKCRPTLHAQQPSKGGELFTFTRFLVQHLGLFSGDGREE